jgi:pimeloyl-ACP methyl ester carboxylesterase
MKAPISRRPDEVLPVAVPLVAAVTVVVSVVPRARGIEFPAELQYAERAFPDHVTVELPDASHFFFEDATDRIVAAISRIGLARNL